MGQSSLVRNPLLPEISCSDVQKLPRFLYGRMRSGVIAGRHSEECMPLSRTDCRERAKRLGNMVQRYGAFLLCPPLLYLLTRRLRTGIVSRTGQGHGQSVAMLIQGEISLFQPFIDLLKEARGKEAPQKAVLSAAFIRHAKPMSPCFSPQAGIGKKSPLCSSSRPFLPRRSVVTRKHRGYSSEVSEDGE